MRPNWMSYLSWLLIVFLAIGVIIDEARFAVGWKDVGWRFYVAICSLVMVTVFVSLKLAGQI